MVTNFIKIYQYNLKLLDEGYFYHGLCLGGTRSPLSLLETIVLNRQTCFKVGSIAVTSVGVAPIALNYATTYATKQNAGCQLALSICKLNSAFETSTPNYGRYLVIAKIVSSSQTGLTISAQTLLPTNNIVSL